MDINDTWSLRPETTKRLRSIDAIIFDVDGTLWDSSEVVAKSWTRAVKENSDLDLSFTAEYLKANAFGKPMDEIGRILLPDQSDEEIERLSAICFKYEDEDIWKEKIEGFCGVAETMAELCERGYKLYIVSNCQKNYIEACMRACGIEGYISDHLCFGDTKAAKDETIRRLMEADDIEDAVYVGDTVGDRAACEAAGVPFIFAAYGFGDVDEPELLINDISELPGLLDKIRRDDDDDS